MGFSTLYKVRHIILFSFSWLLKQSVLSSANFCGTSNVRGSTKKIPEWINENFIYIFTNYYYYYPLQNTPHRSGYTFVRWWRHRSEHFWNTFSGMSSVSWPLNIRNIRQSAFLYCSLVFWEKPIVQIWGARWVFQIYDKCEFTASSSAKIVSTISCFFA